MDNQQAQAFQPKTDYTTDNTFSQTSQAETASGLGDEGDKLGSAAGGSSGDSQSLLDKGISYLQQSITGKGGQSTEKGAQGGDTSHHAAVDAAHPEKISEFLRHQNRSMTEEDGK